MRLKPLKIHINLKSTIASLMTIVLLACSFWTTSVNSSCDNDKIKELEAQINKAKEEKKETQSKIDENKEEMEVLTDTTSNLKDTLSGLNAELSKVCDNVEEIERLIEEKNQEISDMEKMLEEALLVEAKQYEAMKIRIKYMYEEQSFDMLESFFGSGSFSDLLNKNNYFESLAAYDRKQLDEYKHTREVIEEAKALLNEERAELDALMASALEEQDRVKALVERTNVSIKKYEDEIEATEREIAENEELLKQQQDNIAALQKELAEERRLSELASKSVWRNISQVTFAEGDRALLANLIYCEAGNQPYQGQVAVGAVVMNRVMSSVFPDTVVGVIYQKNQFSPVKSGRLALALANDSATESCYMAADAAMSGQTTVGNCLFFRTPIEGLVGIQIGNHIFY